MIDKVRSLGRARFRKTNFNAFLFFLLLAFVIWFFAQFSKTYDEVIEIPVEYVKVPPDKYITKDNPKKLMLQMEATGFRISYYSFFPPTFFVDLSQTRHQDGKLVYVIDEHREEIQAQLGINFEESHFVNSTLEINYEQLEEKTLPVRSEIKVEFAVGYAAANGLEIVPDSITLSGPKAVLDSLQELHTVALTLKNVKEDLKGEVPIDTTGLLTARLYQNKVNYSLNVEKFTEGSVEIPIELINVPKGLNVVIFPKRTLVFYQVNLENYSSIIPADFRVVCDYGEVKPNQDFLIPEIVKKPEHVTNVRLNEKKIQFIIKK